MAGSSLDFLFASGFSDFRLKKTTEKGQETQSKKAPALASQRTRKGRGHKIENNFKYSTPVRQHRKTVAPSPLKAAKAE